MDLSNLRPADGAKHSNNFRKGRGHGSGNGKTAGKGHKGQKARSGAPRPGFEGGQMPLYRRLPKRGFTCRNSKTIVGINVSELERFDNEAVVSVETLIEAGVVKNPRDGVKILGNGELTKKLTVQANAFSAGAVEKIEALGGDVEVKTKYGEGSTFSIRLPLTLAIIQALMVKLGDEKYTISLGAIETIEDVPVTDIKYIHAKEVINLRGSVIPLIRLRDILDVPGEQEESDTITVVIVRKGDKLAGLVVDSLIGQMEIVIKSLGKYININRMISGATILGDGSVALIIDANTLV